MTRSFMQGLLLSIVPAVKTQYRSGVHGTLAYTTNTKQHMNTVVSSGTFQKHAHVYIYIHIYNFIMLQDGAPQLAKLVCNSNNYGLWQIYLYLLWFINQLKTGGHHFVGIHWDFHLVGYDKPNIKGSIALEVVINQPSFINYIYPLHPYVPSKPHARPHPNNTPNQYHILVTRG